MPVTPRNRIVGSRIGGDNRAFGPTLPIPSLALSPSTRLILNVLNDKNLYQYAWRTGLIGDADGKGKTRPLPLILRLDRKQVGVAAADFAVLSPMFSALGIRVVASWIDEFISNKLLERIPVHLGVDAADPTVMADDGEFGGEPVQDRMARILATGIVAEISLPSLHAPLLDTSVGDIGMPVNATYKGRKLTGKDVVIGIIDDGCPFAHQDFLVNAGFAGAPVYRSRVALLWDQATPPPSTGPNRGWKKGAYNYGRQITAADIERAINAPVNPTRPHVSPQGWIDEEAVYDYLGYPMGHAGKLATHGSRVLGIAAGNGRSAMGQPGIAPEAEIVFVHLPATIIDVHPAALSNPILDGIKYVLDYAKSAGKAAVINISYGGNAHAHDGSSAWERTMDQLLAATPDCCIVVSAGNGFEADCHVQGRVAPRTTVTHDWWVKPHDPTPNDLEIWYDTSPSVEISLVAPDGVTYGPYKIGTTTAIPATGPSMAYIDHQPNSNGDCCALIWMFHTGNPLPGLPAPPIPVVGTGPAPAGRWLVRIRNTGGTAVGYHGWIQRDDTGPPGGRRRQSRFDPQQADPRYTIGDLATGNLTISVGAHNAATQEVAGYSAAGPTRAGATAARVKPDVVAPGEEAPNGLGVLSTSSARAQPTRIGGTSASAPHVAGIVALIFDYARQIGVSLTAAQIQAAIQASANPAGLQTSRHQRAARYPAIKQAAVWNDVVGYGKVDLEGALRILFP